MSSTTTLTEEIAQIELQLLELKKKRTELIHQLPREAVKDYTFSRAGEGTVTLSELFGDKQDLLIVHNMGGSCPYCTLWADGFESIRGHLESRSAFALIANDDPQTAGDFVKSRGWTYQVLSGKGNPFSEDMGFYNEKDGAWPGVSAFHKDPDGKIYRTGWLHFGPGDDFCPVWHFFDLLQDGSEDWEPKYAY